MKGRAIAYSAEEIEWLEANRLMVISDYHRGFCEAFDRSDVSAANLHSLRKRKGWKTGRTGCFEKGQSPHNKGKPHPPRGRSAQTQFRKGATPANIRPLWSERTGKDGYIEMKVPLKNPYTGHSTRFMHKHRYLWEKTNGPLPRGMVLKCLDGDIRNTDPANWEAIPRALLPRLAGGNRHHRKLAYADAAPEVRPALIGIAKVEYRARQIQGRRS